MYIGWFAARALADRGVAAAFAAPSRDAVPLLQDLSEAGIRLTRARGPRGAALMAEGHARATGRPAAVILGGEAALAEAAVAMAQAMRVGSPIIALSVDAEDDEADATSVAAITRISRRVRTPEALTDALDIFIALLQAGRPGPVHVAIAPSLTAARFGAPAKPLDRVFPPPPLTAELDDMAERLRRAQRPALLLGDGALGLESARATALAERLGAPTLLTSDAAGLLPPGHRLRVGGRLSCAPVRRLLLESDAVLMIGAVLEGPEWHLPGPARGAPPTGPLLRIDLDEARLAAPPAAAMNLLGEPAAAVDGLLERLGPRQGAPGDARPLRDAAATATPARHARHQALIDALWEHLPDAVVIADPCQPGVTGVMGAAPPSPRRWWSSITACGATGYALAAGIGAKSAMPRRPVIALTDEAGAMVGIAELAAAAHAGINLIFMVWNDAGGSDIGDALRAAKLDAEPPPVDFHAIARGFGALYQRVSTPGALGEALRTAAGKPSPTLLELREEFWFS